MRTSNDQFGPNGFLLNGFDYEHQAWVKGGKYVRCGHPESMNCGCFGKYFEGKTVEEVEEIAAAEMDEPDEGFRRKPHFSGWAEKPMNPNG